MRDGDDGACDCVHTVSWNEDGTHTGVEGRSYGSASRHAPLGACCDFPLPRGSSMSVGRSWVLVVDRREAWGRHYSMLWWLPKTTSNGIGLARRFSCRLKIILSDGDQMEDCAMHSVCSSRPLHQMSIPSFLRCCHCSWCYCSNPGAAAADNCLTDCSHCRCCCRYVPRFSCRFWTSIPPGGCTPCRKDSAAVCRSA